MTVTDGRTFTRAVITAPQQIVLEQAPLPPLLAHQVLVRMRAAALCTWEQRTFSGVDTWSYPLVGGHENAGQVEAIGSGVELDVKVGDQVVVAGLKRCGQCYSCRRGWDNLCENAKSHRVPGQPWGPGGFGEYIVADGYKIHRVGPVATHREAALTEPLACVLHDVKRHPVRTDDVVVIVGAGFMGLLHLMVTRRSAAHIIVSEPEETRRRKALELGADAVIDPVNEDYVKRLLDLSNGRGANVTFVTIGSTRAIESAIAGSAKRGVVSVYASTHPGTATLTLPPNAFHHREVTLSGSVAQDHEDFMMSAELIGKRELDLRPLISRTFPLAQLADAFAAASLKDNYRVLVEPAAS